MTKPKIIAKLNDLGIKHDASLSAKELEALLPKAPEDELEIDVEDPEILRPRELPLVVKPSNGKEWLNEAQAEYARTLNGYAYKNQKKWAKKKTTLLKQLQELGKDPSRLAFYKGVQEDEPGNLTFSNKLISK